MNESLYIMSCTQKDKLLKNKSRIYVKRMEESQFTSNYCHRHDFFSIEHIIDGKCIQYINGKESVCNPGTICLLSPFDEHRYDIPQNAVMDYLCFADDTIFPEVWELLDIDKAPYIAKLSSESFEMMKMDFLNLDTELKEKKLLYYSNASGIVNKIVVNIIREALPISHWNFKKKNDLREVTSYIRYHFKEQLTSEGMANLFHVTPSYFCKYFKKHTGYTFREYLLALRLDCAMRQLNTTNKNVTEICYESGFSTPSYFADAFAKRFGMTPSEYRRTKE